MFFFFGDLSALNMYKKTEKDFDVGIYCTYFRIMKTSCKCVYEQKNDNERKIHSNRKGVFEGKQMSSILLNEKTSFYVSLLFLPQ